MRYGNKLFVLISVALIIITLQHCKSPQAAADSNSPVMAANKLSYDKDIRPVMLQKCTPCHFPEQGKKKMFDTYATTKENIKDIIARVELDPADDKFMPFRSKKPALTAEEIKLFKDWLSQGMAN